MRRRLLISTAQALVTFLRRPDGARGQVLPFVALALVAMFGMAALAVDVGYWRYQQRLEQTAADSAAIGGAIALDYPGTTPQSAGATDATLNGFTNGAAGATVTINNPPLSGAYTTNQNAVEAIVTKPQPLFFAGIFGHTFPPISARSVALRNINNDKCLYALTLHGFTDFVFGGVNAPTCGVVFNNDVFALAYLNATSIGFAGSFNFAIATSVPPQRIVPATDPCLQIAGCSYLTSSTPPTFPRNCQPYVVYGNPYNPPNLYPGNYCGLTVYGSVNLTPGVYYIGGNLGNSIDAETYFFGFGGGGTITGTGVTIVNLTGGVYLDYGETMNITGPASGSTAGVAFFQPTSNNNTFFSFSYLTLNMTGVFYLPTANLTFDNAAGNFSLLVTGSISRQGFSPITLNRSALPGVGSVGVAE